MVALKHAGVLGMQHLRTIEEIPSIFTLSTEYMISDCFCLYEILDCRQCVSEMIAGLLNMNFVEERHEIADVVGQYSGRINLLQKFADRQVPSSVFLNRTRLLVKPKIETHGWRCLRSCGLS